MGQGIPQGDRLDLFQTPHDELLQSAIAGLSIRTFRCGCSFLVDRFRGIAAHTFPPRRNTGRIAGQWGITITIGIAGFRHRHIAFDADLGQRLGLILPNFVARQATSIVLAVQNA
jgi:hypothetical protein